MQPCFLRAKLYNHGIPFTPTAILMASPSVVRRPAQVPHVQELAWGFVIQGLVGSGMLLALVRLLPYYQQQQQRHHLLQTEIERTEAQVRELQTQFQRTFDPYQQPRLIQQATQRLQPHQRQVIWVKPR